MFTREIIGRFIGKEDEEQMSLENAGIRHGWRTSQAGFLDYDLFFPEIIFLHF